MDKQSQNYSEETLSAYIEAFNEKDITTEELLQEVEPLLKEHFLGKIEILNGEIIYIRFFNGQVFHLSIRESFD